jgi:hypothetical protein
MMNKDRIVRLKDSSIVISFNPEDEKPKYRYVMNRDGKIGKNLVGSGSAYVPGGDNELWNKEFELDENDVKRELRFRPGDYVKDPNPEKEYDKFTGTVGQFKPSHGIPKEEYERCMRVVAIPANIMSGCHDYTVNYIDSRGYWDTSSTASDSNLEKSSKEEVRSWSERERKLWNKKHPDCQVTENLDI